ncbi:hypothetical protein IQ07DRAFT_101450 [Pyrenochaeta sp. DS3sAY3a]|nr:hypothetical protein IQ07DRAFT_101450 [Pyrenochaeta sp. DS3sAY3a]
MVTAMIVFVSIYVSLFAPFTRCELLTPRDLRNYLLSLNELILLIQRGNNFYCATLRTLRSSSYYSGCLGTDHFARPKKLAWLNLAGVFTRLIPASKSYLYEFGR